MTSQASNNRGRTLLERVFVTEKMERVAVRADFADQVQRSVSVAPSSARRRIAGIPALIVVAGSVVAASGAIAGIAQLLRQDVVSERHVCIDCDGNPQALVAAALGNPPANEIDAQALPTAALAKPPANALEAGPDGNGPQQGTFPRVNLTEDLRISGANHQFYDLRVSASGAIASLDGSTGPIRIFSPAGVEVSTLASGLPDRLASAYWGWAGDSIWFFDPRSRAHYLAALTPTPRVIATRTIPIETPVVPGRPAQPPPRVAPSLRATYADGGLLMRLSYPLEEARAMLGIVGGDDRFVPRTFMIRTTADYRVVSFSSDTLIPLHGNCERLSPAPDMAGNPVFVSVPFCSNRTSAISPDGRLVAYLGVTAPITDPAVIGIAESRVDGANIFLRSYRVPTIAISAAELESIRAERVAQVARSVEPHQAGRVDSILRANPPTHKAPVDYMYLGNDGSVLIWLYRSSFAEQFLLIDGKGDVVGVFALPPDVSPAEVSRKAIWAVQRRGGASDIVRYSIGS